MLASEDIRLLDRLTIGAGSAASPGGSAGMRRARMQGAGLEFHEHRPYQPGDDLRSIDWTVEARLQQLVVRVSRAEGDLRLHLLVDTSASMGLGDPAKLTCATRLAAALGYVAVDHRDAVGLATFDRTIRSCLRPAAGRVQLFRLLDVLGRSTARGISSLDQALLDYGAAVRGPGIAVVLSDFYEPGAGLRGLQFLLHRGLTPAIVQIVAPEEERPDVGDDMEILDVERPDAPPLLIDEAAVTAYLARMSEHARLLRSFGASHGLPYARVESATPFRGLLAALEGAGLLTSVA